MYAVKIHLNARMKERGLTQQQLSELAGVRQATISALCRGNVERLHLPTFLRIARALGISDISRLLTITND